jgi:hypothetical protein
MAILRWTLTSSQNFSWLKHKLRERKSAPKVSLDDQGEPVAVAVAVDVAVDVSGGLGSGVAAGMVFSTVFCSGLFSVLDA